MTEVYAAVNGNRLAALRLVVANQGPWFADCDLEEDADVSGRVSLVVGELELSGTVVSQFDGTHGLQRKCRVVAGAGGWGTAVTPKAYHNDAGVKARTVAEDAARSVGETIGTFVPAAERVGIDYVRAAGPASKALEDAAGGVPWWVDYEGVTQVGTRPATAADPEAYEVLAFDPRTRLATLAVDDPGAVVIGSIVSERLDAPQTVRELEVTVTANELRLVAWCGSSADGHGRLAGLFRAIVERATDGSLFGLWRYRVSAMSVDRVQLQAISKAAGLPDVLPVSMWPGVAGAHAKLTPGAEVLVQFVEGDRARPVITHFAGKDGVGHVPVELALCGGSSPVARIGDSVDVFFPPSVPFVGLVGGVEASGLLTIVNPGVGIIKSGAPKVKA